jgi:hypothetical protein
MTTPRARSRPIGRLGPLPEVTSIGSPIDPASIRRQRSSHELAGGCRTLSSVVAYVFWHRPAKSGSLSAYERCLKEFPPGGPIGCLESASLSP